MTTFEPAEFPLVRKGNQFEDFTVGRVFEHHWGRTITHGDNALFSDALGEPGTPAGSYPGMIRHNVNVIVEALSK